MPAVCELCRQEFENYEEAGEATGTAEVCPRCRNRLFPRGQPEPPEVAPDPPLRTETHPIVRVWQHWGKGWRRRRAAQKRPKR